MKNLEIKKGDHIYLGDKLYYSVIDEGTTDNKKWYCSDPTNNIFIILVVLYYDVFQVHELYFHLYFR